MARWNQIVVGVDGSPSSLKALAWAGEEAEEHGADLVAMTAWSPTPPPLSGVSVTAPTHGTSNFDEAAKAVLMGAISDVLGDDPPFLVQPRIREGNPAEELIQLSKEADVVVVGSRGLGGFAGLLLGSVSQHVSAHAHCPVVVVR